MSWVIVLQWYDIAGEECFDLVQFSTIQLFFFALNAIAIVNICTSGLWWY